MITQLINLISPKKIGMVRMLIPELGMIKNCLKLEILKSLWDNSYSVLEVSLELLLPLLSFVVCVLGGKERRSLKLPGGYLIMFRDSPRR